jgi:hypothetical protein
MLAVSRATRRQSSESTAASLSRGGVGELRLPPNISFAKVRLSEHRRDDRHLNHNNLICCRFASHYASRGSRPSRVHLREVARASAPRDLLLWCWYRAPGVAPGRRRGAGVRGVSSSLSFGATACTPGAAREPAARRGGCFCPRPRTRPFRQCWWHGRRSAPGGGTPELAGWRAGWCAGLPS